MSANLEIKIERESEGNKYFMDFFPPIKNLASNDGEIFLATPRVWT